VKKRRRTSPTWFSTWPSPSPTLTCRHRLDEIVTAHLQKAAVELAVLADEDRLHRRLHVVVNAARAGAPEEGKRPVVGVEYHLLRLRG